MTDYNYIFVQPPRDGYEYKTDPSGTMLEGLTDLPSQGVPGIWTELQPYPQNKYIFAVGFTPPPAPPTPDAESGFCVPAYKAYYYNQIHIIPSVVNIGRLLSDYDGSVEVWNAYIEESRTLNSIDYPSPEETGTDISGVTGSIPPPPDVYPPLKSKTFNLHIDFEGPPSADSLFNFIFDSETDTLLVTGFRLVVFGFMPQSEYVERFKWLTDLIPAFDGNEQYVKVRPVPRREMSYRYVGTDHIKRAQILNIITAGMAFDFGVPIWEQGKRITATATIGSYEILVDTSEAEYEAGKGFFIWENDSYMESGVIDQVLVDRITLVSQLSQSYSPDSYVMPLMICKMPKSVNSNLNVMNGTALSITFRGIESTDVQPTDLSDSYKGLDVLHDCVEVSGTVQWISTGNWETLDKNTGIIEYDYAQQYAKTTRGYMKTFNNHSDMWAFRQWLYKMAGRVGKFWIPDYTGSIVLTGPVVATDTLIDIVNTDLLPVFRNTPFVTDIEFELMDGTTYRHDVTDVQRLDSNTERMTISPALTAGFGPDDIRQISLLHQVRLDTDTIEFNWDQAGDCTVSFNTREVLQ